ncbi:M23 family metallopeptidase [Nocardioides caeni]|uniref:M23 family metallopeptidase n=2 Tax=Nocardioides caeni TaxID=574700 RepID=A0A4S8N820_9ACTN|nr:M23 family metallopeptidase [Nocardioides caeni]
MTGSFGSGAFGGDRGATVSRDSDRDALAQGSTIDMVEEAERHAEERNAQLGELVQAAEAEAAEIALNRWVLPLDSYRLTATFGEYGLWSSYHTGLDFAAPSGTPIKAVTNGVITSTGFDGAYGNKTVLTLEDGTEIWFCHQSATTVSAGDTVRAGEVIGYVGTTGHVTGAHLHLEVRPGGGDPVDPDAALRQHGVTP